MLRDKTAYCGLDCSKCGAYLAKLTDDDLLRRKTAKQWSAHGFTSSPNEINCDGCKTTSGYHFKHCADCVVRSCGNQRGVETCGHCPDFSSCEKIQGKLDILSEYARSTLQSIRASLK
ncbi:MAG: DUF3795 domain-containing protein [Candidatus Thorarchaeota archaeon]|jgi:hypothetical protein